MRVFLPAVFAVAAVIVACSARHLPPEAAQRMPASPTEPSSAPSACAIRKIEPTRYLRQLSLDLRGRPPSTDELEAVAREGAVGDTRVDAMLQSEEFPEQVGAWHKARLWPNVDKFNIGVRPLMAAERGSDFTFGNFSPDPALLGAEADRHPHAVLHAMFGDDSVVRGLDVDSDDAVEYPPPREHGPQPTYTVTGHDHRRHVFPYYDAQGVPLPYHDAAHCPNLCSSKTDAERGAPGFVAEPPFFTLMNAPGADPTPDDLDPPGKHCPGSHPHRVVNFCSNAATHIPGMIRLLGYRSMVHYWSRGKAIKTGAREAQTREVGFSGRSCGELGVGDVSCGCGPAGSYCIPSGGQGPSRAEHDLRQAIDDEPLAIVKSVVARDEDYFQTFVTRRSFATGPLALFFREQTSAAIPFEIGASAPRESLPDIPYDDPRWHEYVRGEQHAGVLTTTAYLVRFPTDRARVSQFRTEMMCRPFTPSVASFPGPGDACTREPNLAKRCGCRNCHAAIEPMAAWFGRWTERSASYLDPKTFPSFDPMCQAHPSLDPGRCKNYIQSAEGADGVRAEGTLLGYLYRSPEEAARIGEGPRGLVDEAIASGELESCTVRTAWKTLLGRPMTDDELTTRLPEIERDFDAHHRSYRELVRLIVTAKEGQVIGGAGRSPRRLDADRLRTSLIAATGFSWVAPHRVSDPDSPNGMTDLPDADMIEVLAGTLGRANYDTTTADAIDPAITFSKLAGDAARAACRASIDADVASADASKRHLLRFFAPGDTLASNADGVRRNLAHLALTFWGRTLSSEDTELQPLLHLFERVSSDGSPTDAWRAVCIALATDPEFLTY